MKIEAGQVAVVTEPGATMPRGAISPAIVAEAAIDAVESGIVHAIVGPGATEAAKGRVDALLADLG